jgi:serine protease Do
VGAALSAAAAMLCTAAPASLKAAPAQITLHQGAVLKGDVLAETPAKVLLELGFTVLAIPREAIMSLKPVEEGKPGNKPGSPRFNEDLFREGSPAMAASVHELAERVSPAVVQVNTSTGLGSGFIIHPDGYIITNDHVIAGSNNLTVTVFDGSGKNMRKRKFDKVSIIATDGHLDLALLKLEDASGERFPTVPLGSSDELRQGAPVVAIGSPMGLDRSISAGIVSLRNRHSGETASLLVQSTAQISPGNSGGPLFNMRGEVIGVNELKHIAFGAEGLGFAIRVDVLKDFLRNREAFAFDPSNANEGYRYHSPPTSVPPAPAGKEKPGKSPANQ